ncbi:MAG: 2Fe-2S iron-sulfur cluster binding domain-containing protein [Candidatus Latescibacteria bacterium]|nr:2Fe-2S iron-sulfur cluster binding domain-containing protein [Candidatus Latescibacterota bacterium]
MHPPHSDVAFTPAVKSLQQRLGSRANYQETEQDPDWWLNTITPDLAAFIAERDSFYLGTASADGQPYIQHRGGPVGFLKVLDERTLAFADFVGNRQYVSYGNLNENDKAFIFLMDYTSRTRIKIWGTAKVVEDDPQLMERLADPDYHGKPERAFLFRIALWDKNCPQHITPRYTEKQIQDLPECPCCDPKPGRFSGSLEVAEIVAETANVKTLRLVQPGGGNIPFEYLPGQFLTLDIETAGKRIKRSYTIASSPTRPECLEITVKREEMGLVSGYLHRQIKPGDSLRLSAPAGGFTFTGAEHASIVLIAAGVGITPMMSVVRYLTDTEWTGDIFLLLSFRRIQDFIFAKEIDQLKNRHPNLHVAVTLTSPETDWAGPTGRIDKELIAEFVPGIAGRRVHICGPEPMMEDVQTLLQKLQVPQDNIRIEAFGTIKRKPKPASDAPATPSAGNATVTFAQAGKTAPLNPADSVLDAAESIGVEIDTACRSGTCGSCKVKLVSGSVSMDTPFALNSDEKAQGVILACQAKSRGNLEIDI